MKVLARMLIAAGFLMGAYFAVVEIENVRWAMTGSGLLIGLVGVVLAQMESRAASRHVEKLSTDMDQLEDSLTRIVDRVETLNRDRDSIDAYEFHHLIDRDMMGDLDTFVASRESIAHAFGLQPYADVMTHFATGERYLNRSWSASTDGYIDEVRAYLERSQGQFTLALDRLRELKNQGRTSS